MLPLAEDLPMKPAALILIAVATAVSSVVFASSTQSQDNVLTYHGTPDRRGSYKVPSLTWEKAKSVHLDEAFQARITGNVYAQPLY
jgi:hypothetical protein